MRKREVGLKRFLIALLVVLTDAHQPSIADQLNYPDWVKAAASNTKASGAVDVFFFQPPHNDEIWVISPDSVTNFVEFGLRMCSEVEKLRPSGDPYVLRVNIDSASRRIAGENLCQLAAAKCSSGGSKALDVPVCSNP